MLSTGWSHRFQKNNTEQQSNVFTEEKGNVVFHISHSLKLYQLGKQWKQVILESLLWQQAVLQQRVSSFDAQMEEMAKYKLLKMSSLAKQVISIYNMIIPASTEVTSPLPGRMGNIGHQ